MLKPKNDSDNTVKTMQVCSLHGASIVLDSRRMKEYRLPTPSRDPNLVQL